MCSRFHNGSRKPLAKRRVSRLSAASLPRKWSMRKIWSSREDLVHRVVELARRLEVGAERLLHDHARALGQAGLAERPDDRAGGGRRHRQVVAGGAPRSRSPPPRSRHPPRAHRPSTARSVSRSLNSLPARRRRSPCGRTPRARRGRARGTAGRRARSATYRRCGTPRASARPGRDGRDPGAACDERDRPSRRTARARAALASGAPLRPREPCGLRSSLWRGAYPGRAE